MLPTCLLALTAIAAEPPALRQLCIRAPAVILARPLDPTNPTRFTVTAVLRGKGVGEGDEVRVAGLGEVASHDGKDAHTGEPRPRRVAAALLFLEPAESGWRALPAG